MFTAESPSLPSAFNFSDIQAFLAKLSAAFLGYKEEHTSQVSPDRLNQQLLNTVDYTIIPILPKEFDMFGETLFLDLLEALNFRRPSVGEWYWRIPGYTTEENLKKLLGQFDNEVAALATSQQSTNNPDTRLNKVDQLNFPSQTSFESKIEFKPIVKTEGLHLDFDNLVPR